MRDCAKVLLRLTNMELLDLATKRAYLTQRAQLPFAPTLARLCQGELQNRSSLSLHQASILLYSSLQLQQLPRLPRDAPMLPLLQRLGERSVESKDAFAAIQLLNANARCYGAEAPEEVQSLCLQLAQLAITGHLGQKNVPKVS